MKKRYVSFAAVGLSMMLAVPAFAQTVNVKADARVDVRSPKVMGTSTIKNFRDDMKVVKGEFNARLIQNRVRSDLKVFTAAANRLDKIVSRIESRILKIKANGGVTTEIETNLAVGKVKLAEARVNLSAFSTIDLTSATSTTTARALLQTIKTDAQKTKEALKASHAALIKAVSLMGRTEAGLKIRGDKATTTNATTTSN